MSLPHVPNGLIDYLTEAYPLKSPSLTMSEREIWIAVGKQEVVDALRAIHQAQQEAEDTTEGLPNVLSKPSSGSAAAADPDPGGSSATAARSPGSAGNRLGS